MANTPSKKSFLCQIKDTSFHNQYLLTKEAFFKKPCTMREVEVTTGVLRPNICRYVKGVRANTTIQKKPMPIYKIHSRLLHNKPCSFCGKPSIVPF